MDELEHLLTVAGSPLADAVRGLLRGVAPLLRAARAGYADDPAGPACDAWLAELDRLDLGPLPADPAGPNDPAAAAERLGGDPPGPAAAAGRLGGDPAPSHPALAGPHLGDSEELASVVAGCLALIDADPGLHHALYAVYSLPGVVRFDDDQRRLYRDEMLRRYSAVKGALSEGQAPLETMRARLGLDEAVHSLLHWPPDAPDAPGAGLAALQRRARASLYRAADEAMRQADVVVRELQGDYAGVRGSTRQDVLCKEGGRPGEVQACLRAYARLDGQEYPGRVVFRSLRD